MFADVGVIDVKGVKWVENTPRCISRLYKKEIIWAAHLANAASLVFYPSNPASTRMWVLRPC